MADDGTANNQAKRSLIHLAPRAAETPWNSVIVTITRAAVLAFMLIAAPMSANAQVDAGVVLSDPVMKSRIDRVLNRLDALFAEDREVAEGGVISDVKSVALRRELKRMVSRAEKSGLPLPAVADALQQVATERFGDGVPDAFAGTDGNLNARALIRGIVAPKPVTRTGQANRSYLSAISKEGSRTRVGTAKDAPATPAVPDPVTTVIAPTPESPAAELETEAEVEEREGTLKRVVTIDGKRYLVIQSGDTLGSIARDVYGDMLQYRRIYEANREKLSNPNVVTLGMRLEIP